ncbi:ABC transporter ATP-binding protein [Longirhabdus pacifica]|uniref:ABC transporter ATP-binding protein n=1 Tax=Longirhabdus pacifica TaxID=2305227 RepID=UPI001008F16B|nr:ABC transporter ATP-binding protein [Longirhabdus pacifica]
MIVLHDVKKHFTIGQQKRDILHIPEWQVKKGEQIAIVGPSGSGKSTLLHILSGMIQADEGVIEIDGQNITPLSEAKRDQIRSQHIGYIMQDLHLIPSITAQQNVEIVLKKTKGKLNNKEHIKAWFEKVQMSHYMQHLPSQLSRGQKQRVAIIRALINQPSIVLADEPTGSLDWETAGEVMRLLLKLSEAQQTSLIVVTHDKHLAQCFPKQLHIADFNAAIESATSFADKEVVQ